MATPLEPEVAREQVTDNPMEIALLMVASANYDSLRMDIANKSMMGEGK